jgi:hypothetical protein
VAALKGQLEVRNISTYKVWLTQTSWEHQLELLYEIRMWLSFIFILFVA